MDNLPTTPVASRYPEERGGPSLLLANSPRVSSIFGTPSRRRSPIWEYFEKIENADKSRCKVCETVLSTKNGVTTNLAVHLKTFHKEEALKYNEKAQIKIETAKKRKLDEIMKKEEIEINQPSVKCFVAAEPYNQSNPRAMELDKLLLKVITRGCHSFSLVEEPAVRELMFQLDKRYVVPSRIKIGGNLLNTAYNEAVKDMSETILEDTKMNKTVSLTSDGWSGKDRNKSHYNSMTAHWIKDETFE